MKRFLYTASVKRADGSQTFYVDAESQEDADRLIEAGGGEMYASEVEVTDLGELEPSGTTTLDDFGDFPPTE